MPPDIPDFPTWFFYAIAGAGIIWAMPRFLTFALEAFADALVDKLETRLAPRWAADIDDRLEAIEQEFQTNGGETLRDRVDSLASSMNNVQQQIELWLQRDEFDQPSGTPDGF